VATAWTLGSGIGFLLVGRLSDIFGRKWMVCCCLNKVPSCQANSYYQVLGCQVLGTIGCIVGATAPNINALIGANLCNGIAAAGQLSFGIIIGELVPNKLRGAAIALIFLSSMPFAGKASHVLLI
jgi:MFS family permease